MTTHNTTPDAAVATQTALDDIRAEIAALRAARLARHQARPALTQSGWRASYDYDGTPQHVRCEDAPCCGCC